MTSFNRISLLAVSLMLVGQGCFGGSTTAGADGAVWVTRDLGSSWTQLQSLPQASSVSTISGVSVNNIEIDPSDHSAWYIGTEANGMFHSLDNGQTWMRPENGAVKSGAVIDIEVHPESVCTTWVLKRRSVLKSSDCVRTYEETYTEGRSDETLSSLALDWFNPNVLYLGTTAGDILKSSDGGRSWANIFNVKDEIATIEVSNQDSRVILIGTEDKGLWRSTDSGATWVDMEDELKKEYKGSDEVYEFAQTRDGKTLLMSSEYGILRSFDAGETWEPVATISSGKDLMIWGIAIDPENPDIIYYGTQGTFYSTTVGGGSWTTEDMPSVRVPQAMMVHPSITENVIVGFVALEE